MVNAIENGFTYGCVDGIVGSVEGLVEKVNGSLAYGNGVMGRVGGDVEGKDGESFRNFFGGNLQELNFIGG